MSRRRAIGLAALIAVVVVTAWIWHRMADTRRYERAFGTLAAGMPRQAVIARMGSPDWRGPCGGYDPGPDSGVHGGCADEFVYKSFVSWFNPIYVVRFDRRGQVQETFWYASP